MSPAGIRVEHYGVGDLPPLDGFHPDSPQTGDFILTRGEAFVNKAIAFGQNFGFYGVEKTYRDLTHSALILNEEGAMAEALTTGVIYTSLTDYKSKNFVLVRTVSSQLDRAQIRAFADEVVEDRTRYGVFTIASIILTLLTGSKLIFGYSGTAICSGFVSEALCRSGYIFQKPPSHMMPADLAEMFNVKGVKL